VTKYDFMLKMEKSIKIFEEKKTTKLTNLEWEKIQHCDIFGAVATLKHLIYECTNYFHLIRVALVRLSHKTRCRRPGAQNGNRATRWHL
jgi:hypothetical protein